MYLRLSWVKINWEPQSEGVLSSCSWESVRAPKRHAHCARWTVPVQPSGGEARRAVREHEWVTSLSSKFEIVIESDRFTTLLNAHSLDRQVQMESTWVAWVEKKWETGPDAEFTTTISPDKMCLYRPLPPFLAHSLIFWEKFYPGNCSGEFGIWWEME